MMKQKIFRFQGKNIPFELPEDSTCESARALVAQKFGKPANLIQFYYRGRLLQNAFGLFSLNSSKAFPEIFIDEEDDNALARSIISAQHFNHEPEPFRAKIPEKQPETRTPRSPSGSDQLPPPPSMERSTNSPHSRGNLYHPLPGTSSTLQPPPPYSSSMTQSTGRMPPPLVGYGSIYPAPEIPLPGNTTANFSMPTIGASTFEIPGDAPPPPSGGYFPPPSMTGSTYFPPPLTGSTQSGAFLPPPLTGSTQSGITLPPPPLTASTQSGAYQPPPINLPPPPLTASTQSGSYLPPPLTQSTQSGAYRPPPLPSSGAGFCPPPIPQTGHFQSLPTTSNHQIPQPTGSFVPPPIGTIDPRLPPPISLAASTAQMAPPPISSGFQSHSTRHHATSIQGKELSLHPPPIGPTAGRPVTLPPPIPSATSAPIPVRSVKTYEPPPLTPPKPTESPQDSPRKKHRHKRSKGEEKDKK